MLKRLVPLGDVRERMFDRMSTALCLASVFFATVCARQIPVVNGVIGGVPNTTTDPFISRRPSLFSTASTAVGGLRIVENSGVCETTPGVYQASGYADLSANNSLWFWYFDARKNPDQAPLALWFNGGPGSSSMIGLFQEHGPCRINNDSSTVSLNPFSWNNEVNMLYIDQPIGVGFSYGNRTVGTSQRAAEDVWTMMQIFLGDRRFSRLQNRTLAIWTESYGGHYGPTFAAHFLSQNAAIDAGNISGLKLNLKFLGIGDGLTDPLNQYPGFIKYAGHNPYHVLVNSSTISHARRAWTEVGGCRDQIKACYKGAPDAVCSHAQSFCNDKVLGPLAGNWDVYYVLTSNPDPYPPSYTTYINGIASVIGAQGTYQESSNLVYNNFAFTGDWMRNSAPDLETVIDAGVRTIVYDGDADYILNFYGVEAMVDALQTRYTLLYRQQHFRNYTVNGQLAGQYKNAGTFSYLRVYGAGHEVPAYKHGNLQRGQAAAQMFTQIMSGQSLEPTLCT